MTDGAAISTREIGTVGARCSAKNHSAAAKSPVDIRPAIWPASSFLTETAK